MKALQLYDAKGRLRPTADGKPLTTAEHFQPIDVCAGCGQTLLTTPDDPMTTLWCDTCQGGAK